VAQSPAMRLEAALLLLACAAAPASAQAPAPALPRSTPEAQGVSSAGLLAFLDAAEQKVGGLHSLMVLRHGRVVAEGWWKPYKSDAPHVLYSLSKSFASTGIGLAVAEGKVKLDDTVLSFFPDDAPPSPSDNLKAMRVRDLLSMSTGHHQADIDAFSYTSTDPTVVRAFLALPVVHKPGTHFVYNTPASYMLSAIVQKVSGTPLVDYLRPRLFEPLGIRDPKWDASPQGVSFGGFGLSATTEDIARFAQLYLQRGEWNGRRILPAEWVDLATSRQVSNGSRPESDWEQGYGFQFWRCRHGFYRGDGAFGQYAVVMPEKDAVVAITSGVRDMQAVMNLIWEHLAPAMQKDALPADAGLEGRLKTKLAGLALAPPSGRPTSITAKRVSGRLYELPKNDDGLEALGAVFEPEVALVARIQGREYRVPVGRGEWRGEGTLPIGPVRHLTDPVYRVGATGAWTADDTFTAKVCFTDTPFCNTLDLRFAGDALVLDQEMSVNFGPTRKATLVGTLPRPATKAAAGKN